jgi:hypothetical protein
MLALILTAALTCAGSLALGQGVLALCGARAWNWMSAPVGIATMILLAVPAIHVPGRSASVAALIAVLILAGVALWIVRPEHRPPVGDLLASLPVALLVLVPFAASGRAGTLGVSFDNDMGAHLLQAEAYRSQAVAQITPLLPGYPLGAHALAAALTEGLGIRIDLVFAGLTAATPVLLAWTALAKLQRVRWTGRLLAATVVGMPFLIAGFYAEGSFKELFEAIFVLAAALMLDDFQSLGVRRWIPFALVLAGAVSVYSAQGLVWPVVFLGVWLFGRTGISAWKAGLRGAWNELRAEIVPGTLGLGVLILVLVPQIPRVEKFISQGTSNNIAKTNIGNLVGPLPGWEVLGVWNNRDFRLPPTTAFTAGMWSAFVLALVILGVLWSLRRNQWMLPAAAAVSMLIWDYTARTQSPYVAAKALVIASPLILMLAVLPLVERAPRLPAWWSIVAPLLAMALVVRVVDSSWEALRYAGVGPTDHVSELRSLRPLLGDESTLIFANDDFIPWELAGARVTLTPAEYGGVFQVPLQSEKHFAYGQPLDFDSVSASTLNRFDWVITTRDAAGSAAPPQMHLVRVTRDYALWKRIGQVEPRSILSEGPLAAATLNCQAVAGRALIKTGGVAAIRAPSIEKAVPLVPQGADVTVTLHLGRGEWALETPYDSPLPVTVTAPGLLTTLPANLDRPGPRWPIGQISVSHAGPVNVTFHVIRYWLTPESDVAAPVSLIATPLDTERVVPLKDACGRLVDWYRER